MNTKYHTLALATLLSLTTVSALAESFDEAFGSSVAPQTPPAAAETTLPVEETTPVAEMATPTGEIAASTPVADANGYMPDPTTATPAEPTVPQLSQAEKDSQLWLAARNGDVGTVASMIQQGGNPNTATAHGETALHAATAAGSLQTVMYLVQSGADVNATTSNGWTALHHAARFGKADIANYLKQRGLNPNAVTAGTPKSPIQMALDNGDLRTARILGY